VLVTSFDPLLVYMYKEGLVRFAAQKYSAAQTHNPEAHLTNYSVNKNSEAFVHNEDTAVISI